MKVRVTSVWPHSANETVTVARGIDQESSERVLFAGDWRPMENIREAMLMGEAVIVDVEPWQVVRRHYVPCRRCDLPPVNHGGNLARTGDPDYAGHEYDPVEQ